MRIVENNIKIYYLKEYFHSIQFSTSMNIIVSIIAACKAIILINRFSQLMQMEISKNNKYIHIFRIIFSNCLLICE